MTSILKTKSLSIKTQLRLTLLIIPMLAAPLTSHAGGNPRLDYVRRQLASSQIASSSFNRLIYDKRLRLYPIKPVAYKQPDWKIIQDKLYSPAYLQKGRDYIAAHQDAFNRAENSYGVKKE